MNKQKIHSISRGGLVFAVLCLSNFTCPLSVSADELAPLPLELPRPAFKGTPTDLPTGPHLEPFSDEKRPDFMAPKGVVNLALNKPVTSSDDSPITGELSQVTDGEKSAADDTTLELHKGVQWVQIDLGQPCQISAILIWHDHRYAQAYRSMIVQVADNAEFTENVRTLYNNDFDNTAGLGVGTDKQYFETNQGRLIDAKGATARYVRSYTRGSNGSALNCYNEIEVYGLPAK
jgi:hypothetical protein